MAVDSKLSWAGVQAAMDGLGTALSSGYLRIYDNNTSVPTNADDSNSTNVLLAELRFASVAFGDCDATGTITANALTPEYAAVASGTPAYARYYQSDGTTCLYQGTAGTASCDVILDQATITASEVVVADSVTMTGIRE
jgi:hypothetical protein